MSDNLVAALLLTLLAGSATGIGSLISYLVPRPEMRYLSMSLGFASGVMIYLAFVDLFCSSRDVIGLAYSNMFFISGVLLMHLLDRVVPHIHINGQADAHCSTLYRSSIMSAIGIAIHNLPEGIVVALDPSQTSVWGCPSRWLSQSTTFQRGSHAVCRSTAPRIRGGNPALYPLQRE